ncbi:hypothetical protein GQ53DRAFT_844008 [Thozetella sp. PMI_491]|nr:hypothetical protein GQ53DRAFT_844008 [Thozetella sp. PMI_491]
MSQDVSTIVRPTLLCNAAQEFMETRAGQVLDAELISAEGPQYVAELDKFMPKDSIPKFDYQADTKEKMAQLKKTLSNFVATIKERGFDKKLNITLKDLDQYNLADVIDISDRIAERHRNADKAGGCMGLIRKCFHFAGKNRSMFHKVLECIPEDIYGSVISGGFTIILTALERAENVRHDIYEALADIPRKLQEVQDLAKLHYWSPELHYRASSVIVAILTILERIVNELTKSMAKKSSGLLFKGDRYGTDVSNSIADLEKELKAFKSQAEICAQQKFGRMDRKVTRSMVAAENTEVAVVDMQLKLDRIQGTVESSFRDQQAREEALMQKLIEARSQSMTLTARNEEEEFLRQEMKRIRHMNHQTNVQNNLYVFLTGNPVFDPRNGTLDKHQYRRLQLEHAYPLYPSLAQSERLKAARKLTNRWLKYSQSASLEATKDIKDCVQSLETLSFAEKDQVQWILASDEMSVWLRAPQSAILVIQAQENPGQIFNPISFSAALITKLLRDSEYPTISYLCGRRASEGMMDQETLGPRAMLASLFAQLIKQAIEKYPGLDIASLGEPPRKLDPPGTIQLWGQNLGFLAKLIPEQDCVFIIVDSLLHLDGSDAEVDDALNFIMGLVETSDTVVKIIFSVPLSLGALEDRDDTTTLFLPNFVDGGNHDTSLAFLGGDTMKALEMFQAQQKLGSETSDSDDAQREEAQEIVSGYESW